MSHSIYDKAHRPNTSYHCKLNHAAQSSNTLCIFCIGKLIKLNQSMPPNYRQAKLHDKYEAPSYPDDSSRTKTYTALVLGTKCTAGELHQTPRFKLSNKEFNLTQNTQYRVWKEREIWLWIPSNRTWSIAVKTILYA